MPFWLPNGTVLLRLIEARGARAARASAATRRSRRREVLDEELWHRSGHWDNYRENMYFVEPSEREGDRAPLRAEADELPRRLPGLRLRAPLLPRAAAAPGRVRRRLPLRARGRPARAAPGARLHPGRRATSTARSTRSPTRSTRSARRSTSSTRASASTTSGSSSRPGRRSRSAPTSSGSGPTAALREALERQGREYDVSPGEGTFYGPKIDFHVTDALGRSWQLRHLPARLPDARALRAHLPGRGQRRAPAGDDPPRAARLDGALRRDPDRALRRPLPGLAGAGAGGGAAGLRPPPRLRARGRRRARRGRACGSGSTSARSRSGGRSATPSSRRLPYMLVVGEREQEAGSGLGALARAAATSARCRSPRSRR